MGSEAAQSRQRQARQEIGHARQGSEDRRKAEEGASHREQEGQSCEQEGKRLLKAPVRGYLEALDRCLSICEGHPGALWLRRDAEDLGSLQEGAGDLRCAEPGAVMSMVHDLSLRGIAACIFDSS